ncbi:DUF4279 domain-containing protein [Nocardia sp. XZ_19_385]|uniref:DUF4279 domain-containing protein n=1 Tax=Nocardia sp. XZ_19_385 TaxID=2769488 RepID=UPI001890920D|nr:DUF4279 domain-containing protein [Nocardia sp. XZ_19_385]
MKVRQYSYFKLQSTTLSPVELTARLLVEPDEFEVKGSLGRRGRLRGWHIWKIIEETNEAVDDQIQCLIDRLAPARTQLLALAADPDIDSVLQIVRYFHDPDGVHYAPAGTPFDRVREWPRPLGWHLPRPVLEFLASTGTELDVDEYYCRRCLA